MTETEEYPENEDKQPLEQLEDVYEVIAKALKIHGRADLFNEDFTLADPTTREKTFITEQMRTIANIRGFIADRKAGKKIEKIMNIDVYSTLIMSRAKKGRLIKGIIAFFTGHNEQQQQDAIEEPEEPKGFFKKLFSKTKR